MSTSNLMGLIGGYIVGNQQRENAWGNHQCIWEYNGYSACGVTPLSDWLVPLVMGSP